MTINDFRGQVKIQDVQNAFDEIVDRINTQIDRYNEMSALQDIDVTKGSSKLAAPTYTLTVGGLKSVLESYEGSLIGCKAFRLSPESILVSDGFFIKGGQAYRISAQTLIAQSGWDTSELFYDSDNNIVCFRDGAVGGGVIVDGDAPFVQPSITSNTSYGTFTASINSGDAYKCTGDASQGNFVPNQNCWACERIHTGSTVGSDTPYVTDGNLTWNLPKAITLSNLSFRLRTAPYGASIRVLVNDTEIYRRQLPLSYDLINEVISLPLNNIKATSIKFEIGASQSSMLSALRISQLVLTGASSGYSIDVGGVITPSPNIIKICDLNWKSDELVLNYVKDVQLENSNKYIKNQDRTIDDYGLGWETINTSDSAKFMCYTSRCATASGSDGGYANFLGKTFIDSRASGSPHRGHWIAQAISLIFIPKGFVVSDTRARAAGRYCYSMELKDM